MQQTPAYQPVPSYGAPRDRRRRKRIFTLRNAAKASLLLAVLFAAATLIPERYRPDPGEHGRLYQDRAKTVPTVEVEKITPVIEAAPVAAGVGADPLLLDAAKREQYLGVGVPIPLVTPETIDTSTGYQITPQQQNLPRLGGGIFKDSDEKPVVVNPPVTTTQGGKRKIVISGGAEGVELRID